MDNIDCIICLENIETNFEIKKNCSCQINIHEKCFEEWNKVNPNKCPLCREKIILPIAPPASPNSQITPVTLNTSNILLNPLNNFITLPIEPENFIIIRRQNNNFIGDQPSPRNKCISCLLTMTICGLVIFLIKVFF